MKKNILWRGQRSQARMRQFIFIVDYLEDTGVTKNITANTRRYNRQWSLCARKG